MEVRVDRSNSAKSDLSTTYRQQLETPISCIRQGSYALYVALQLSHLEGPKKQATFEICTFGGHFLSAQSRQEVASVSPIGSDNPVGGIPDFTSPDPVSLELSWPKRQAMRQPSNEKASNFRGL